MQREEKRRKKSNENLNRMQFKYEFDINDKHKINEIFRLSAILAKKKHVLSIHLTDIRTVSKFSCKLSHFLF